MDWNDYITNEIFSERGINVHMFPIMDTRWHKPEGRIIKKVGNRAVFVAQEGSRWDLNCFKFMDFLATYIKNEWDVECSESYQDILEDPYRELTDLLPIYGRSANIYAINKRINPFGIYQREYAIPFRLISKFISCKGWTKDIIKNVLQKISSYKIKTKYALYCENIEGGATWKNKFSNMSEIDEFQSIFDYDIEHKAYSNKVNIKLNSQLGAAFLHNIFSTGYCFIDESLYSLSNNAQILFRKRYLPYTDAAQNVTLNKDKIFHMLGLNNTSNKTVSNKLFKQIIDELVSCNLIKIIGKTKNGSIKTSKVISEINQNIESHQ
jgi:hypothetical protein